MFKPARSDKVSTHIVNQFRTRILKGDLKPGQSLPPEKDLMVNFGVSKHTLREALRALEALGLIEIKRGAGGGPVVRPVDMETTRNSIENFLFFKNISVRDLSEVRRVFEPHLTRMVAANATEESKDELLKVHQRCVKNYNPAKRQGVSDEVNFHVFMARQSGNPVMVLILDLVNNMLSDLKSHLKPGDDFVQMVHKGHQKIVDSIMANDADAAAAHMLQHLQEVEDALAELSEKMGARN